jgi:hypothetical protein
MKMLKSRTLRLQQTCPACPEQYDVYRGTEKVGYIRLRWGQFSARLHNAAGEEVVSAYMGDELLGCFRSNEERQHYLAAACQVLLNRLDKPHYRRVRWSIQAQD